MTSTLSSPLQHPRKTARLCRELSLTLVHVSPVLCSSNAKLCDPTNHTSSQHMHDTRITMSSGLRCESFTHEGRSHCLKLSPVFCVPLSKYYAEHKGTKFGTVLLVCGKARISAEKRKPLRKVRRLQNYLAESCHRKWRQIIAPVGLVKKKKARIHEDFFRI